MKYYEVWLRNVKGCYTWHFEQSIRLGSRVLVSFRGRKRVGIVVLQVSCRPEFKTLSILEVWDEAFILECSLAMAKQISENNFCDLSKVLSLMIPEAFLLKQNPESRESYFSFTRKGMELDASGLRGGKQKIVHRIISEHGRAKTSVLRAKVSLGTLKGLVKQEIIKEELGAIIDPFHANRKGRPHFEFTPLQQKVFDAVLISEKPVLLFGVTGSGKTEIYKKVALEVLEKDETAQVLFLLPEIALTSQLISEFYGLFGNIVAVWHSKLSDGEKIQEYARLKYGEARILIGARSAVLLPLQNPKLIILDEEHEWTYKNEFAPRFQTHDIAQSVAQKFNAKLIFGSATPRLESFDKCERGEWNRVDLPVRVFETLLPEIQIVDLKNELKKGNSSPISERLEHEIESILQQKKQAVLFLNKRGYSGSTMCRACGYIFECSDCSFAMKLHKRLSVQTFICHICGKMEPCVNKCPECNTEDFVFKGWGTQQVEQYLQGKFPGIRIFRADADSVSGKHDFEKLMNRFHDYDADILLGTQMVAKGLDFARVELVGVVLADVGFMLPDFRAEERVFQLLTQVSGRAGRRANQGKIVIQTYHPHEKIFQHLRNHDTEEFVFEQLKFRKESGMSPYGAVVKITFSDICKGVAFEGAKAFYCGVKEGGVKVNFVPAFFPRSHNKYHFHVFLWGRDKESCISFLKTVKIPEGAKVDVAPSSLL